MILIQGLFSEIPLDYDCVEGRVVYVDTIVVLDGCVGVSPSSIVLKPDILNGKLRVVVAATRLAYRQLAVPQQIFSGKSHLFDFFV